MIKRNKLRESAVEEDLRVKAQQNGIMCLKFTSPGTIGVPDRVLIGKNHITGEPITVFVETKRPGESLRLSQVSTVSQMLRHGAKVAMTDSYEANDRLLENVFAVGKPVGNPEHSRNTA